MAWVFPDEANPATHTLRESLIKDNAVVPVLWPIEVANLLLVATRRGRMTEEEWPRIRNDLHVLPIKIDLESHDQVLERVLPIAAQYELSVYDAMYLELALRFGLPLVTLDRRLNSSGKEAGLVLLCA